jgi:hypothetical protein
MEKVHIGVAMCDEEMLPITWYERPCYGQRTMVYPVRL